MGWPERHVGGKKTAKAAKPAAGTGANKERTNLDQAKHPNRQEHSNSKDSLDHDPVFALVGGINQAVS